MKASSVTQLKQKLNKVFSPFYREEPVLTPVELSRVENEIYVIRRQILTERALEIQKEIMDAIVGLHSNIDKVEEDQFTTR